MRAIWIFLNRYSGARSETRYALSFLECGRKEGTDFLNAQLSQGRKCVSSFILYRGGWGGGVVRVLRIGEVEAFVNDVFGAILDFVEEDADVLTQDADGEQLHTSEKDDGRHDGAPAGLGMTEATDLAQECPEG